MEVLGSCCRKIKWLRIERGADEQEMEDEEGVVSQKGLTAIAQDCTVVVSRVESAKIVEVKG